MAEKVGEIYYDVTLDTRKMVAGQREVDREVNKAAKSLNEITKAIKLYAAALAVFNSARMADDLRLLQARVTVAAGSVEKATAAMSELVRVSARTQTEVSANVAVFTRLNGSILAMGGTQRDTLQLTELLAKALKVGGASATEASSAMTQFAQALGSGQLAGDEFKSLAENAPFLMQKLADGLGVARGALKQMAADGELTADVVTNALMKSAAAIEQDFATIPQTLAGAMTVAEDSAKRANEAFDTLTGTSAALTGVTKGVGDVLDMLAQQFAAATSEGGKLGRNESVKRWAEGATQVLTYLVDAGDVTVRVFRAMGLTIYSIAAAAKNAATGDFAVARSYIQTMQRDIDALLDPKLAGAKMRAQIEALAMVPEPDRLDMLAAGLTGKASTLKAPPGTQSGKDKPKKKGIDGNAISDAEEAIAQRIQQWAADNETALDEADARLKEEQARGIQIALGVIAGDDPIARLALQLQQQSDLLNEYAAKDQANAETYALARIALEQQTNERIAEIVKEQQDKKAAADSQVLQGYSQMLGSMAEATKAFGGKQNAVYKALFAASKAFAIAESIIKIQQGVANAASLPFPANLGAMASVVSATASIVSTIQSVQYGGGRRYGGGASAGKLYQVNEAGRPEMFTAANGAQFMLPTRDGRVTSAGEGSAAQPWTVNVYEAPPGTRVSIDHERRQVDIHAGAAEVADQIVERRGPVWGALAGTTNVRGVA